MSGDYRVKVVIIWRKVGGERLIFLLQKLRPADS